MTVDPWGLSYYNIQYGGYEAVRIGHRSQSVSLMRMNKKYYKKEEIIFFCEVHGPQAERTGIPYPLQPMPM